MYLTSMAGVDDFSVFIYIWNIYMLMVIVLSVLKFIKIMCKQKVNYQWSPIQQFELRYSTMRVSFMKDILWLVGVHVITYSLIFRRPSHSCMSIYQMRNETIVGVNTHMKYTGGAFAYIIQLGLSCVRTTKLCDVRSPISSDLKPSTYGQDA